MDKIWWNPRCVWERFDDCKTISVFEKDCYRKPHKLTWRGGKISSFHALILLSFGGRDNLFFWDITAENLQVAKILNAVLVPAKIIFSKKNRFRVYRKLACTWITIAKGLIDSAIHSKMEISFAIVYY